MPAVTTRLYACPTGHWRGSSHCGSCRVPTIPACETCLVALEHPAHQAH